MNKIIYLGLIISSLLGLITYIVLDNLIYMALVFVISLLYFILVIQKRYSTYYLKNNRFHQCYVFINTFLISLSINNSLTKAFSNACDEMPEEFNAQKESMEELNENEKFIYLKKYFNFHLYQLFVDIVFFWVEQGGNILAMSENLLNELRDEEEYILFSETINKSRLIEFGILWFFCLLIITILRFALMDFYPYFLNEKIYVFGILGVMFLILFSIEIFTKKETYFHLKEGGIYERE